MERRGWRSAVTKFEVPTVRLSNGCITVRPLIGRLYYLIPLACRGVRY